MPDLQWVLFTVVVKRSLTFTNSRLTLPADILQQPALDRGQGGVLLQPRAQDWAWAPRQLVGGHPQRAQRAQEQQLRQ